MVQQSTLKKEDFWPFNPSKSTKSAKMAKFLTWLTMYFSNLIEFFRHLAAVNCSRTPNAFIVTLEEVSAKYMISSSNISLTLIKSTYLLVSIRSRRTKKFVCWQKAFFLLFCKVTKLHEGVQYVYLEKPVRAITIRWISGIDSFTTTCGCKTSLSSDVILLVMNFLSFIIMLPSKDFLY